MKFTKLQQSIMAAVCVAAALPASAATITASATAASANPTTAPGSQSLQNGDFFIAANPSPSATTGDGVDEFTYWSFDFNGDPGYAGFIQGGALTSAILTLDLNTLFFVDGVAPITDRVIVGSQTNGLPSQWNVPSFMTPNPTGGYQSGTITVDLVSQGGYQASDLFAWLKDNNGHFAVNYGDDAIVTGASLTLVQAVPEPGTYALMLAGLGLIGGLARRRNLGIGQN